MEIPTSVDFTDLNLSAPVLRSLKDMGFEAPTPVQAYVIPLLLERRDVVAQALTGTGKTAAYGIPLAELLDPHVNRPQAIVLTPTRELAVQVSEHLSQLGRHRKLDFLAIYGGQPIDRQLRALRRGVQGLVATPGRLMDHMARGSIDLSTVRILVLDEADQMLQMGFQEDVEHIVAHMPEGRHTALFSATMPRPILNIVHKYMREPEMIHLSKAQALTVPSVEQSFVQVPFPRKLDALCRVLDARSAERTLVFCATKRMVDEVAERLPAHGYAAEALHGDMSQSGRERVLKSFRDGRIEVLVATDVAARGLDVPDVALVVNFDIPPDPEYYVHRIGRTARSGRSGQAVTFVNPREMRELKLIEQATGARIHRVELPTPVESEQREAEELERRLLNALDGGGLQPYRSLVEHLATDNDLEDIATAALALLAQSSTRSRRPVGQVSAPPTLKKEPVASRPTMAPHKKPSARKHISRDSRGAKGLRASSGARTTRPRA